MVNIRTFCLGEWQTNCYVVWSSQSPACWIVDAGFGPQPMIDAIEAEGLEPAQIVLTHAHVDHIGGLCDLRRQWPDLPIWIHEDEADFLLDPVLNLSGLAPGHIEPLIAPPADRLLTAGETLDLGTLRFEVRHTPGHSPGGICLYEQAESVALVGDTLFFDSIGRHDFPTSDGPTLMCSIREQLLTLPDETRVLPGHMIQTTIGRERRENPFLGSLEH